MKYEKWSFGYWCLKQYIIFSDWLIHKKTIVTGREKIPHNKPIVFAPNHQNALSDPLAVLLNTRFQPVWLARADIFKSRFVAAILRFLKIMPVYRIRDGKENLSKNDKIFADSIKVLESNSALALFPEAAHSGKRQMLAHKKAVPRIAFMAEEKAGFNLDIQVIPVGIYYSHYWKFNRTLIVHFGDPIPVKDFVDSYKENEGAAIIELRDKIYESILPLVIDIRSKKHYEHFELIREVYGHHFLKRQNKQISALERFYSDQKLVNRLDELKKENPEVTKEIAQKIIAFASKLKKLKIRSWLIGENGNLLGKCMVNLLVLLTGLPVFVYGLLFNAIPFFTIDRLVRKKVKDHTFWSTFFLVAGIVLFPLIYVLELVALAWLLPGFWLKLAFLASLPFAGKLAFKWYIVFRKTIGCFRMFGLKWFHSERYKTLVREKQALFQKMDELLKC